MLSLSCRDLLEACPVLPLVVAALRTMATFVLPVLRGEDQLQLAGAEQFRELVEVLGLDVRPLTLGLDAGLDAVADFLVGRRSGRLGRLLSFQFLAVGTSLAAFLQGVQVLGIERCELGGVILVLSYFK